MSSHQQHIILFYKYHPLSPDKAVTERYRAALEQLCTSLELQGRILVGCSKTEGINGTLSGNNRANVLAFTYALLDEKECAEKLPDAAQQAVATYRQTAESFFASLDEPVLQMSTPADFKWSTATTNDESLFPDLNIKLVNELIGTGGAMADIPIDETAQGYLTPTAWHEELLSAQTASDTILIDCRNTKEHQIGHFVGALDPQTTTFQKFPKWVEDHEHLLADKKVRMFCTGGIRCEKASAYIRRHIPSVQNVKHLQGGIHKYLEQYGSDSDLWKGRNFVFDGRGAASAEETRAGGDSAGMSSKQPREVVGRCAKCAASFDEFDPSCVCTVCREPTLVCLSCRGGEYHCSQHDYLKDCYFSNLQLFSEAELQTQLGDLQKLWEDIAIGRKFRGKRKTLEKQMDRVQQRLDHLSTNDAPTGSESLHCRNCGEVSCSGRCWGFYSLKRKEILDHKQNSKPKATRAAPHQVSNQKKKRPRREQLAQELKQLQINTMLPSAHRDSTTGVRVPPCTTRVLHCSIKAKWCGDSVVHVLQEEFPEVSRRPAVLKQIFDCGLVRVNEKTVVTAENAADLKLKSSDSLSRVVHWHEAPVCLPAESLQVERIVLPENVVQEYDLHESGAADTCAVVYACNKPSTVPVHPAGPYLANSLTVMIEAQEKLPAQTLNPLHRTDRVTSGLTLCSTNTSVSRLFHTCLAQGHVRKLYLAQVKGEFPNTQQKAKTMQRTSDTGTWSMENDRIRVDAPVHTKDPANGFRVVAPEGKGSQSVFRRISYCSETHTSVLACYPITGRNHQLRVHLQWLGFPIVGDTQYGGESLPEDPTFHEAAVELMTKAMAEESDSKIDTLTKEDVAQAKKGCPCCAGGTGSLNDLFTDAQLLKQGHAIRLHALRYRLSIYPKKTKSKSSKEGEKVTKPLTEIVFSVDPPTWADGSMVSESDDLEWLE